VEKKIVVEYDGAYPNLCSGTLVVVIDGMRWAFPKYCLSSGGQAWSTADYAYASEGAWSIRDWPENFPSDEELRQAVVDAVNAQTERGCCGGCQ
jgi:hypothetical protein